MATSPSLTSWYWLMLRNSCRIFGFTSRVTLWHELRARQQTSLTHPLLPPVRRRSRLQPARLDPTLAPVLAIKLATAAQTLPLASARCRAVFPSASRKLASAPYSSKRRTIAPYCSIVNVLYPRCCHSTTAQWRLVRPPGEPGEVGVGVFGLTPRFNAAVTSATLLSRMAVQRVRVSTGNSLPVAPKRISLFAMSVLRRVSAVCNGHDAQVSWKLIRPAE